MLVEARFKFYGMLENLKTISKWVVSPAKSNEVEQIEGEVSGFLGRKNFKFTTQCRSAIYLAVKHVIDKSHYEIIVPAYTIYDVLNMIIAAGGTPVLVDVSETSGNIDINSFEAAITKRTAAVLVPHLHGIPADAASIRKLCDAHKILFIEDVAQANGSMFAGKTIGTFGDISVYSFGRAKNINSFFGGGISCNHEKMLKNIALL